MKNLPLILRRFLLVACLGLSSCAPRVVRGVMTYERIEVIGRPHFEEANYRLSSSPCMEMWIEDGKRPSYLKSSWNNDVLDRRRIDTKRIYQFELLEGSCLDTRGEPQKSSEVWRVRDHQRIIYDASFCRVHKRIMERQNRHGGIDVESLPRGFDSAKARNFPNTKYDHAACYSLSFYSTLDWTCPQCSEAETSWLEKHPK